MDNYKLLMSNSYKKGMKWLQVPENKIDTVIFNPISNTYTEGIVVAEETFNSVTKNGNVINLPCSIDTSIGNTCTVTSYASNSYFNGEMCKGAIGIKTAIISHTFELEDPVVGTPVVKITLSGTTTSLSRGANGYDSMPSRDASSSTICSFINSHKSGDPVSWESDSDISNYSEQRVWTSTFVKDPKATLHGGSMEYRCTWNPSSLESHLTWIEGAADISDWDYTGVETDGLHASSVRPEHSYDLHYTRENEQHEPITVWINQTAILPIAEFKFNQVVTRINGRRFEVTVEIPIMVYYFAAARTGWNGTGTHHRNIDSNGAFDLITSVKLELVATKLDETSSTRSYSLDAHEELTTDVKNKNPFTFNVNNFITLGTRYGLNNWMESMALYLLKEYKKGKYILEFEVSAHWAITNNIQINTLLKVKNLFNEFITRDDRVCLFEVKTIEKQYKNSEFTYRIRALESAITTISIGNIGLVYTFTASGFLKPNRDDIIYVSNSNNALEISSSEEDVRGSGFYLGNGIALASVNTVTGSFLVVPGAEIGRKIVIAVKCPKYAYRLSKPKITAVLYSASGTPTIIEQSSFYYAKNDSKNSDYFMFLVNLNDRNHPYMLYLKIVDPGDRYVGEDGFVVNSVQIYNAGNVNLNVQEAYEWLVDNNKLI